MIKEMTSKIRKVGFAGTLRLVLQKGSRIIKYLSFSSSFYLVEKPKFLIWRMANRKKDFELPCYYPFYYFGINWDGSCYLCCSTWQPYSVGNLKSKPLREAFNSIQAQKIRLSLYKGDLKYCKTMLCDIVNSKNYKPFSTEYILNSNLLTGTTKKEILKRKLKISDGPSRITDGISNICNIQCRFCYNYGSSDIASDEELIEKMKTYIIDNIRNLRLLNFSASGEPFVQKHVKDIVMAAKKNREVGLYFTTNLNYIDSETKKLLKESNVVQVHASINAANKKSYDKTVDRGNWENVMKNLDFFIDLRERQNKNMWIQISMVVTNFNYADIRDFAKLGLEKNLNKVIIYPMVEHEKNRHIQIGKNEISEIKKIISDKIFEDSRIEIQPLRDFMEKILSDSSKGPVIPRNDPHKSSEQISLRAQE
jgi:MoaA/NifB/PqqE/SkfB family radical SAM enzyme